MSVTQTPDPLPPAAAKRRTPVQVTSRRTAALARRLGPGGKIFAGGSTPIPIAEPGWQVRWFNGDIHEGRHYQAVHELGWEPLRPEHLSVKPEECGLRVNESGFLVRGTRGNELLCRMPIQDYAEIQRRKTDANNREIGRPSQVKEAVANHVATQAGDEGGQFVKDHFVGSVEDRVGTLAGVTT